MLQRFFDRVSGGFFDAESKPDSLGVLSAPRKPFQDSPTPAGNSVAVIALLRLHGYSGEAGDREKAEQTLDLLAGSAGQYGLFAGAYGLAALRFLLSAGQIVIVGEDENAAQLHAQAYKSASFGVSVLKLDFNQATAANLPPSLGQVIPELPAVKQKKTVAVVCTESSCKPPVGNADELRRLLSREYSAA